MEKSWKSHRIWLGNTKVMGNAKSWENSLKMYSFIRQWWLSESSVSPIAVQSLNLYFSVCVIKCGSIARSLESLLWCFVQISLSYTNLNQISRENLWISHGKFSFSTFKKDQWLITVFITISVLLLVWLEVSDQA